MTISLIHTVRIVAVGVGRQTPCQLDTAVVIGIDHDLGQPLRPGIADGIPDPRLQNDPRTFTLFQTLPPPFQIDMVIPDMTGQFVLIQNFQDFIIRLCRKDPLPRASRSFREISLPFCGCSATSLAGGKEGSSIGIERRLAILQNAHHHLRRLDEDAHIVEAA